MKRTLIMTQMAGALLLAMVCTPAAHGQSVPADTLDLATGPFAEMQMLLQKTIFKVDVFTLRLRFGEATATRFEALVADRPYSSSLADSIADAALEAVNAWAVIDYLRDVELHQYLDGIRNNMKRAVEAGLISDQDYDVISAGLPTLYAPIEERKILRGDRIYYRVHGDTVQTVYQGADGGILLDHTEVGAERRMAVMGGYFAPKSSFREELIESLFETRR
jgi:hypothetical protein